MSIIIDSFWQAVNLDQQSTIENAHIVAVGYN